MYYMISWHICRIENGTQIMGLFSPIPCRCLTVSKIQSGLEGVNFETGCLCIGVQIIPLLQIQIARVCVNNNGSSDNRGCPMDWVHLNEAQTGHAGHV